MAVAFRAHRHINHAGSNSKISRAGKMPAVACEESADDGATIARAKLSSRMAFYY